MRVGLNPTGSQPHGHYRKANRAKWTDLGFRQIGSLVHDEDRELVLAELEVRKFDRLLKQAFDKRTSPSVMYEISQLNMTKLVTAPEQRKLYEMRHDTPTHIKRQINWCKEQADIAMNKRRSAQAALTGKKEPSNAVILYAKMVTSNNLVCAYWRLIKFYVTQTDVDDGTVFGVRDG